jgi:hypothetical protein
MTIPQTRLVEGSTFITTEFARFGLTVHPGTKEPNRVPSKTEAMYIPARSTPTEPSATEDYDVGDNRKFISYYDSFLTSWNVNLARS